MCDRVNDEMTAADMRVFSGIAMPQGTIRHRKPATSSPRALIVTRLGEDNTPEMSASDVIRHGKFYLVDGPMNSGGVTVLKRLRTGEAVEVLLFWRRHGGRAFRYLGALLPETSSAGKFVAVPHPDGDFCQTWPFHLICADKISV